MRKQSILDRGFVLKRQARLLMSVTLGLGILALTAASADAMPQYSRKYNLKCSACHTIAPVLNEQGYMFKRLGYHLPPALTKDQPSPTIADLVKKEPQWTATDNLSVAVADFAYQSVRNTQEGTDPTSSSAFQLNTWNTYAGGSVPDTNFFYFSEFDIFTNGVMSPTLSNAYFGYTGGSAKSSWYLAGGLEHLEIGQGTRAAEIYSLLPAPPLLFESASPTNFVFDQSPVGINAGYTWASNGYKNILAVTAKVTNGDNADGSEILGLSNKNSKDVLLDIDWWFAPESGITFLEYHGSKDQVQNAGTDDEFTYRPTIQRTGVFANYMIANKVDVLGGYMFSKDDWQTDESVGSGNFKSNDYFGEVNYYIKQGLALTGRYDFLSQGVTGNDNQTTHQWSGALNRHFTPSGAIIGRLAFSYLKGSDPVALTTSTGRFIQADVSFNF